MRSFLLAATFLILASCGSEVPSGAVMAVGDRVLYPEDVTSAMQRARGDSTAVRVMTDNILARELFLVHAGELGLDTIPNIRREMYERRREVLQNAYINRIQEDVTVTPEEVRAFTDSLDIQVIYSAFYTSDGNILDEFLSRLEQGEDFNSLVSLHASDALTRETGGRVGPLFLARTNRHDYSALRSLEPGQISEPFPRLPGWRMVRLDSIWHQEADPELLERQNLDAALLALRRESRRIEAQDSLLSWVDLRIDTGACSLIASRARATWGDYEPFSLDEQRMAAITWNGGERSLIDLAMNIVSLPPSMPRDATDPQWIADYAFYLGLYDAQAMVAITMGLDTIPQNARLMARREAETLLDQYHSHVLAHRITVDEDLLNQHFLAARDTMVIPEARVFVHAAGLGHEQVALLNAIHTRGDDPVEQSDQLTFIPDLSRSPGSAVTRPMTEQDFPEPFRVRLMGLQPGESMICSLESDFHVYFRLQEVIPDHAPELEEIRHILEPRVLFEVETMVIAELVDSLKSVYRPFIDREFFDSFIEEPSPDPEEGLTDERQEEGN